MAKAANTDKTPGTDVVPTVGTDEFSADLVHAGAKRLSADIDWSQLRTEQDILGAVLAEFGDIVDISEYSDGFVRVDKESLVGHKLLILDTVFVDKDPMQGKIGNYVVVRVLDLVDMTKKVFSDGSTGIFEQLTRIVRGSKRRGALGIPNGLRYSDYLYTDKDGDQVPARTYYLDDSPAA